MERKPPKPRIKSVACPICNVGRVIADKNGFCFCSYCLNAHEIKDKYIIRSVFRRIKGVGKPELIDKKLRINMFVHRQLWETFRQIAERENISVCDLVNTSFRRLIMAYSENPEIKFI